ncbi:hypothetical protein D3C81_2083780 [compost metagenome]
MWHDISYQPIVIVCTLVRCCHRVLNTCMLEQSIIDLLQLDTVSTQFDLEILTANELYVAVT